MFYDLLMEARGTQTTCKHSLVRCSSWGNLKFKSWEVSESLVCVVPAPVVITQTNIIHICNNTSIFLAESESKHKPVSCLRRRTGHQISCWKLVVYCFPAPGGESRFMDANTTFFPFHILRCSCLPSWQRFSPLSSRQQPGFLSCNFL